MGVRGLGIRSVRLLQVTYIVMVAFLALRCYAAIERAKKLTAVLLQSMPDVHFNYMAPAIQYPTLVLRVGALAVLLVATIFLLNRAIRTSIPGPGPAFSRDHLHCQTRLCVAEG